MVPISVLTCLQNNVFTIALWLQFDARLKLRYLWTIILRKFFVEMPYVFKNRKEARHFFLSRRQRLCLEHPEKNEAICQVLSVWLEKSQAHCVGFYMPFRGEPDITKAITRWMHVAKGRCAALPIVDDEEKCLMHYARWDPNATMRNGAYGIIEPVENEPVSPDVVLAPCVAFNWQGYRLGNGKGYFDRYLAQNHPKQTVAVAFSELAWPNLIPTPLDIPMQWIATERGIVAVLQPEIGK